MPFLPPNQQRQSTEGSTRKRLISVVSLHSLMVATFAAAAMDVSADLRELGRTPVSVVSAGIKSILDIGRTLQYLVSLWTICQISKLDDLFSAQ